jgi:signal peptidase I
MDAGASGGRMSIRIEHDSFWHQDMERLPPGDEGASVIEVRLGGKSAAREIVETIVLTLLIFLAVRAVVQNYRVEGASMVPTLANEQMLLVDKVSYFRWDPTFFSRLLGEEIPPAPRYLFGAGPQRGDIVVLRAWNEDKDYIKRVIGLPGEQIEVRASDGVYINGAALDEPYINEVPNYNIAPLTLPSGEYYVLGDNRTNSSDSHVYGPARLDQIVGRAWISYWPPSTLGALPHATYNLDAGP